MFKKQLGAALALLLLLSACTQPAPGPSSSAPGPGSSSLAASSAPEPSSGPPPSASAEDPDASQPERQDASTDAAQGPLPAGPSVGPSSAPEPQELPETPASSSAPDPLQIEVMADRADETSIYMKAAAESYPSDAKSITFEITNGSAQEISSGTYFTLEKKEDGQWNKVRFKDDTAFADIAQLIPPGQSVEEKIALDIFAQPLSTGEYRVSKEFAGPEYSFTLSAGFSLGAPEGTLELKKPKSVRISIGNGKYMTKTTLTLKQKYEGKSPVSFVMEKLDTFHPVKEDMKLGGAAETDGALLTLIYPDGMQRELFVDPNAFIENPDGTTTKITHLLVDGQQWYYSLDADIYSELMDCAMKFGGEPELQEP